MKAVDAARTPDRFWNQVKASRDGGAVASARTRVPERKVGRMTLLELFKLLKKHLALVVVLPVVLAIATAGVSWGLMQNQYTATVSRCNVLTSSSNEQNTIQNSSI